MRIFFFVLFQISLCLVCQTEKKVKYYSDKTCKLVNHLFPNSNDNCITKESELFCVRLKKDLNKEKFFAMLKGEWIGALSGYSEIYKFDKYGNYQFWSKGINDEVKDAVFSGAGIFKIKDKSIEEFYKERNSEYSRLTKIKRIICSIKYDNFIGDFSKAGDIGIEITWEGEEENSGNSIYRILDHPEIMHEVILFE